MNIAILLAGGVGKRAACEVPKQFVEVNHKPLIVYTLEKFQESEEIARICVVCVKEWIPALKSYAEQFGITKLDTVCEGGNTGLESLKKGLAALDCEEDDLILIHDAVRPFVDAAIIKDNIAVAKEHDVAMTAVDCVETLVYMEKDGYAEKMIPRDYLQRIQTPQTFKYRILKDIYHQVKTEEISEPSIFALYMRMGNPIYCSKGNDKNIKITYPEDIEYFKKLFS